QDTESIVNEAMDLAKQQLHLDSTGDEATMIQNMTNVVVLKKSEVSKDVDRDTGSIAKQGMDWAKPLRGYVRSRDRFYV
ncbi:hypothetical protein PMAYCL1PPCAC_16653, partial [Pristionchus mayeri]